MMDKYLTFVDAPEHSMMCNYYSHVCNSAFLVESPEKKSGMELLKANNFEDYKKFAPWVPSEASVRFLLFCFDNIKVL